MNNIKAIGGFDKELELTILRDGYKIEYLNDAIIYDEKVQKAQIFATQRKRWLSAQLVYFRRFFFSGIYHLLKSGKLDFFDKVYQMITPPRILLFVTSGILFIFYFILEITNININYSIITHIYWGLVFVITTLALIIATPSKYWNKKTFRALSSLPKAVGILYKSLLNLKGANKKFIHTQHNS